MIALTEKQEDRLYMCSEPIVLGKADLSKPWVYDRDYGLFYCPPAMHQYVMAELLAIRLGYKDGIDTAQALNVEYSHVCSDFYLKSYEGTAFFSSVGRLPYTGKKNSLNRIESRIIGEVKYLFESDY